jgi:hypothetical protein
MPLSSLRLVKRFFNKIKQCRRVATRYDRLAANYLAFIQLASMRLWLPGHAAHNLLCQPMIFGLHYAYDYLRQYQHSPQS